MPAILTAKCLPRSDISFPVQAQLVGVGGWGLIGGDPNFAIGVGTAAVAPAIYTDLSFFQAFHWADMTTVSILDQPGGASLIVTYLNGNMGGGATGLHAWAAVFRQLAPAGSDVPIAVCDVGLVDAL
jgi:hypothetical protein